MTQPRLKMRLGDLLVSERIITDSQLQDALASQKRLGRKLGRTLVELGYLSEHQLLTFLSQQLKIPYLDIAERRLDPQVAKLVPEVLARRYRALVLEADQDSALIGMSDPADLQALDALEQRLAPRQLRLAVVEEAQLLHAFDGLYRRTQEIASYASQLEEEHQETADFDFGALVRDEGEGGATVARLLQSLFEDAVQMRASDIHIEPEQNQLRIRQRIDGVLQENVLKEARVAGALVLRLKLMAGLDISEKRLPQDGRFHMQVRGHNIDVRLSTMPVQYGEAVVMRLLDQSAGLLRLEDTGMPAELIEHFRRNLKRPHGMVLVTGPTGSGKTTTLYGALAELNEASKKIITVEDPVEYRLPRINQVQVNHKIGLDFSQVLRTTLRHDPDILMVGEMRDEETVDIGLRGAITGHLVLSTLHTNDAVTCALRLIDMGAQGYLVASALRAVLAQRLVRRLCPKCARPGPTDAKDQLLINQLAGTDLSDQPFKVPHGCQSCHHTGYRGRIGVFELLELDGAMNEAMRNQDPQAFTLAAQRHPLYRPLASMALDYARQGITSVEEVLKLWDATEESLG
ncbi:GspE/PulE family protein [Gallaecimonas xiamenensis]|uniref:Type II secretory pathway, ATPase n=1 Tax=Gallaecimonas xiamenensis 3-C-1 TaxID=745411 RepID=K2IY31_9GAMM|nr:GspE/PulE family protein [Gallaecimonas xiamenensis]EKE67723.1 Type II secretory pathway, ATPase [Gallaecimonas xiamenensis 3-C-1]